MRLVLVSTFAFLGALLLNVGGCVYVAFRERAPALPLALDQRLVLVCAWGFLVLSVWGFNARWLPVFLGLPQPNARGLAAAVATLSAALLAGMAGAGTLCSLLLIAASALAVWSLRIFRRSIHAPKLQGIHHSFPYFLRAAYIWLFTAAALALGASLFDDHGGITGASRHALTVGFIGTMVFSIGSRVLPAFCGMRVLYSSKLMFYALATLNAGCILRVFCEIPAYEMNLAAAWKLLPVSAIAEMTGVTLFVANLLVTFAGPPAHVAVKRAAA